MEYGMRASPANGAIYKRGKFRNYCDATRCHKAGIIIGKADKR